MTEAEPAPATLLLLVSLPFDFVRFSVGDELKDSNWAKCEIAQADEKPYCGRFPLLRSNAHSHDTLFRALHIMSARDTFSACVAYHVCAEALRRRDYGEVGGRDWDKTWSDFQGPVRTMLHATSFTRKAGHDLSP